MSQKGQYNNISINKIDRFFNYIINNKEEFPAEFSKVDFNEIYKLLKKYDMLYTIDSLQYITGDNLERIKVIDYAIALMVRDKLQVFVMIGRGFILLLFWLEEKKIYNESKLDKIFLSYDKILYRLNIKNIKTKDNKEITHKDLRKAITVMQRKHKNCRWKIEKIRSRNTYILIEGYYWLVYVYFNNEKKLVDADIEFFEKRIKQYEKLLNLKSKKIFEKDLKTIELVYYFNKKYETIEKAIWKMIKVHNNYRYIENEEYVITKEGVKWLCKNCFKQKYLEILENYKMELTEKYIRSGYIYDNFFNKN